MEEKACEKCYENLTGGERTNNQDSRTNLLNDCQNSNETIDTTNDKSEITVLANNLDKALTVNHNDKNLPNGLSYDSVENNEIEYVSYRSELQMPDIMRLIQKDLSEPYSIYTYRYFIHNWPKLCFLAVHEGECVGAVVCKLDIHRKLVRRGYIAMLAVDQKYRKRKIGSNLVLKAIRAMSADNADEVVLETEITNRPALKLYENLGFVRDKRLFRYYLNGVDALRLKLWLK
ncbi:N-terminal acetyltransferase C complex catalytic subunit Mak3, putative [Pediculus humanus corporis]|uniref:N-terminal methionine N(alpha)-acetyltransferase NatC n=1 Tax=Pediculus humanus subsp. corporis TaxID=121224 RepID=E0VIN5_PEDHC|nr:N-terminal acetyltransferase C complex catalytic subunit Mak3, putative [Pediculus humanus corporis]EEB13241.1 N-terminal acetyltransferase C complex catalytic subunit Mak3, putative [Pediculus humanus corporis]